MVASHFPFPYGEIAADIIHGKIDAVEFFGFGEEPLHPRIRDWYRFLNVGYRIPAVGGTDKMSAGTPIGAVRTYAHIGDRPPSFESWKAAVAAGNTFVTSGPLVELTVEGHSPGETLELPAQGGTVTVEVEASHINELTSLDIVVNGIPVAETSGPRRANQLQLSEELQISRGSWIAARCWSNDVIWSAFPTAVAAHTSPVYVDCGGETAFDPADSETLRTILNGGCTWAGTMATVESDSERERFVEFFSTAETLLGQRAAWSDRIG